MSRRPLAVALVMASVALGCGAPSPSVPASAVSIRVLDDEKEPVRDAEIYASGNLVARTDATGRAEVTVSGKEGATFNVEVRCPALYRSPTAPLVIRRFDARHAAPEYAARCDKTRHTLVVAIRTQGAANMPVLHLGKEVARTDESGSAHVLVEGEVHERIELTLLTTDPKHAKLHPQNPLGAFEVAQRDEVKIFDVRFTQDPKPIIRAAPRTGPKAF